MEFVQLFLVWTEADVAMRSMGMPALKLLERILKKSPNFVFYDDNKAMIGVVRSGRNPTMRHLERSHGVSISWMHEMFTRDYMYLAYEVTDRMAADIYTKAFNMETCMFADWST